MADTGLSREEALRLAPNLLRRLREHRLTADDARLTQSEIDVMYGACEVIQRTGPQDLAHRLGDIENLYRLIESVEWPNPDFGERAELKASCAFAAWRAVRSSGSPQQVDEWRARFLEAKSSPGIHMLNDRQSLDELDDMIDSESILVLLAKLPSEMDRAPSTALRQAALLHHYLERVRANSPAEELSEDELDYFLGESAWIAGAAARFLLKCNEANRWFDLAESWFLKTKNSVADLARVAYQRLALLTEERDFDHVLNSLPALLKTFEGLGMPEDALKARVLEAIVLKETDRLPEAIAAHERVIHEAKTRGCERLLGHALTNLVVIYSFLGEADQALKLAAEAKTVLVRLGMQIPLAILQWGIGYLNRQIGETSASIENFRAAQLAFAAVEMQGKVAEIHLVVADLLLDIGRATDAESEIRRAVPLIDEYKLVPEGLAAMTLLRESLRRQKIDRQALRNLHGYFEERKS